MGKKQKKKATQSKKMSQKICIAENEEDETDCECWGGQLLCASDDEDNKSIVFDLEEVLKIKVEDQQRLFNKRESVYKDMISRLKRLYDDGSNRSKGLEAEIISIKEDLEKSNKKNAGLEAENISLKADLEASNKKNAGLEAENISLKADLEELLQALEKQENGLNEENLKLNDQEEEGRRKEESMMKHCQGLEVEVNILKGKLEEKDKLLKFQDSTKILDNILSSQRSPSIKFGLGFHETVKGESSVQGSAKDSRDAKTKPEVLKETRSQSTIMNTQMKSFNNVECYKCHNYGHVAANCRIKLFQLQTNRFYTKRYSGFFKGYCFSCNEYGHKVADCNRRKNRETHHDPYAYFSGHMKCYTCNKYGHVDKECRMNRYEKLDKFQHTIRRLKQIWKKKEDRSET